MKFSLERIENPEIEVVTLAETIQHLREFSSISAAAQTQISGLIVAGREWAEEFTGRSLIDQTWRLTLGDLVGEFRPACSGYYYGITRRGSEILLRRSPVLSVLEIASVDTVGVETVVEVATYEVREPLSKWPRLVAHGGASWASSDLRITFRAGFADRVGSPQQGAEMVPERFKQAIKLWVEANYNRDKDMMQKLLSAAEAILRPERAEMAFA